MHVGKGGLTLPSAIRHFVVAFLIAALIFSIVGALAIGWFGKAVREKEKSHVQDDTDTTDDTKEEGNDDPTVGPVLKGQSFSVLLILNDYQPDRYDYELPDSFDGVTYPRLKKADTLVYLRFNRENATLYTSVIPVASVVTVNGVPMTLAETYHYKGASYLCDKVSAMLGARVNYYCSATYGEFVSFINGSSMNGITTELSESITVTLRSGSTVTLKEGKQYLDGERVLALIKNNGIGDSKLRAKLRVSFAHAILEKLTTLENKLNPDKFYNSVLAPLTTNLSADQISANLDMIFSYFDLKKEELTVPGEYDVKGNFIVDTAKAQELFRFGAVLEQ